jgi:hypothetical protein
VDWTQTGSAWRKSSLNGEINPTNRINCTISCGDKGSKDIKNEVGMKFKFTLNSNSLQTLINFTRLSLPS